MVLPCRRTTPLLRPDAAAAAAATITTAASAIADADSALDFASATATCHHPRHATAGRWPPPPVPAGAAPPSSPTPWLPDQPLPSPPVVQLHLHKSETEHPDPFERPTCLRSHHAFARPSRAQTLHVLCGSSITTSAAPDGLGRGRSAGRGSGRRLPTCCVCVLHALMHVPHTAVSLSLSL